MMSIFRSSILFLSSVAMSVLASTAHATLQTVPYVDVTQYLGTWYQISHNPLAFQGECACSQQKLGLAGNGSGRVTVYNSCNDKTPAGPVRDISGFATSDDPASNSKFTVDFGLPRTGAYWIIGLGDNYEYSIVSDPTEASLYILSKTPTLDQALYDEAVAKAAAQTDISKLVLTEQNGCVYP